MDTYAVWLKMVDWVAAFITEGMMHDDFPEYDWRSCFEYGDSPAQAVSGALYRSGFFYF